jgi:hypothetical protein
MWWTRKKQQQLTPPAMLSLPPFLFHFGTDDGPCKIWCELYRVSETEGGYCWFVMVVDQNSLSGQWLSLQLKPCRMFAEKERSRVGQITQEEYHEKLVPSYARLKAKLLGAEFPSVMLPPRQATPVPAQVPAKLMETRHEVISSLEPDGTLRIVELVRMVEHR